jgi:hypothetical protein
MTQVFKKSDALTHWAALPKDAPLRPHAIAYKSRGSTYGHDGVRVEGSRDFIDAVLGRLSDLLDMESDDTRISISYQTVEPRPGKDHNGGEYVCYLKFHERGPEARIANRVFGRAA